MIEWTQKPWRRGGTVQYGSPPPDIVYCHNYDAPFLEWVGSLFSGISTFVGYLIPEPFFKKNCRSTIKPIDGGDKAVHAFPKCICPKVNVIARLEFELAYYDSAVQRFKHYTTRRPPLFFRCGICRDTVTVMLTPFKRTGVLQRSETFNKCLGYDSKKLPAWLQFWSLVEYPSIAIAPRFTLTRCVSTSYKIYTKYIQNS